MTEEKTGVGEKRVGFRLTAEHHKIIEKAATQKGLSVPLFIRMAALDKARELLGEAFHDGS